MCKSFILLVNCDFITFACFSVELPFSYRSVSQLILRRAKGENDRSSLTSSVYHVGASRPLIMPDVKKSLESPRGRSPARSHVHPSVHPAAGLICFAPT